ncbi:hypothetical protein [Halorubrum lipolyticum]|nr:hypothetical protein [Halorubrum lipolyticum]
MSYQLADLPEEGYYSLEVRRTQRHRDAQLNEADEAKKRIAIYA